MSWSDKFLGQTNWESISNEGRLMPTVVKKQIPRPLGKPQPKTVPPPSVNGSADNGWPDDSIQLLIYGDSSTGKTRLWGTFPGPVLTLLCSGGNKPGELRSIDTPENRRKITPRNITTSEQFCEEAARAGSYETVVLDHVTGMQSLLLKEHLRLPDLPAVQRWGMGTQADWGAVNQKTIEMLREVMNLAKNFVIVGHEKIFKGKEESGMEGVVKPFVSVAVSPQVAIWIQGAISYAVQTFKRPKMTKSYLEVNGQQIETEQRAKGVEYCARTEEHDVFYTKFRVPPGHRLPEVIVDPTYDKIQRVLQGR